LFIVYFIVFSSFFYFVLFILLFIFDSVFHSVSFSLVHATAPDETQIQPTQTQKQMQKQIIPPVKRPLPTKPKSATYANTPDVKTNTNNINQNNNQNKMSSKKDVYANSASVYANIDVLQTNMNSGTEQTNIKRNYANTTAISSPSVYGTAPQVNNNNQKSAYANSSLVQ
jgi:hypothetical protein